MGQINNSRPAGYGYFPKASKTWLITKKDCNAEAKLTFFTDTGVNNGDLTWASPLALENMSQLILGSKSGSLVSGVGTVKRLGGHLAVRNTTQIGLPLARSAGKFYTGSHIPHYDIIISCGLATSLLAMNKK